MARRDRRVSEGPRHGLRVRGPRLAARARGLDARSPQGSLGLGAQTGGGAPNRTARGRPAAHPPTPNTSLGSVFYSAAHAFLQRPAAEAVVRAARALRPLGYGLLIHDAYRPWYVTKVFWDGTPRAARWIVADP